jgi:hypothetical protein
MTIIVDTHQHFWNYGTYRSSWMEAPPYACDPVYQHSDARFTLTIFCPSSAAAAQTRRPGLARRCSVEMEGGEVGGDLSV